MSKAIITEQHLHDIADAIIAKGGATAPMTPALMPDAIREIKTGGTYEEFTRPSDWPDIDAILANHRSSTHGYNLLLLHDWYVTSVNVDFADRYVTSEGEETDQRTSTLNFSGRGYRWIVASYDSAPNANKFNYFGLIYVLGEKTMSPVGIHSSYLSSKSLVGIENLKLLKVTDYQCYWFSWTGPNYTCNIESIKNCVIPRNGRTLSRLLVSIFAGYCTSLRYVDIDIDVNATDLIGIGFELGFSGCRSLRFVRIRSRGQELGTGTIAINNANQLFMDNNSLETVPECFSFRESTTMMNAFNRCYLLKFLPDEMDMRKSTSFSNTFGQCYSLLALPTHVTANLSISFSDSYCIRFKDSVATFDSNGNVIGGFVGNLRSWNEATGEYQDECPNSGQTIMFNSNVKELFKGDDGSYAEWNAIVDALSAKNWGCSPGKVIA